MRKSSEWAAFNCDLRSLRGVSFIVRGHPSILPAITANRKGRDKRLVFLHVPRSAGSNLWHSAAKAFYGKESLYILDIYHESLARYQTVFRARKVAEELDLINLKQGLVHHHTSFGLWRVLGNHFTYFTLLRDPIERAISHYFHSLAIYYDIDEERNECRLKPRVKSNSPGPQLGDDALESFLRISRTHRLMTPEAIIEFMATHRGLAANYYVHFMYRYFEMDDELNPVSLFPCTISRSMVADLARKMNDHFRGIFFRIEDAFAFLEKTYGRKIRQRNVMRNHALRARMDDPHRLRQLLLPYFQWDYHLLELLREPIVFDPVRNLMSRFQEALSFGF